MNDLPQFLLDQSPIQSVSDLCLFTFRSLYLKQPSASPADTVFPRSLPLSCGLQGQQFLEKCKSQLEDWSIVSATSIA